MGVIQDTPLIYRALLNVYRSDLEKYERLSGMGLANLRNVAHLYDALMCEKMAGEHLDPWTDEVYPEGLKTVASTYLKLITHTPYMLKEKSGPLINEIRNFFSTDVGALKFQVISGHDSTLLSLARAFRLTRQLPAIFNFTGTFGFELYTGAGHEELIKV